MKHIKRWLFPALTCLIVAGAALLPPRISQLRDAGQLGQVHAQPLEADALPVREAPSLLERLALYARWYTSSEAIPSFHSPEVDGALPEAALTEARLRLAEADIIPCELAEALLDVTDMDCILLWDPTDSMSGQEPVSIWRVSGGWDTGSVGMDLDAESGLPLRLNIYDPNMAEWLSYKDPDALPDLARRYFGLLGVEAEMLEPDDAVSGAPWSRLFSVTGVGLCYYVSFNATMLNISVDTPGAGTMVPDGFEE